MRHKKNVLVVFGGKSAEHEISIQSAQSVILGFPKKKYNLFPLAISKQGKWLNFKESIGLLLRNAKKERKALLEKIPEEITDNEKIDVVFSVLHGPYGEDGTIQGLFEMMNVAYVGASVSGSVLGMDKVIQKKLFGLSGIDIIPWMAVRKEDLSRKLIKETTRKFNWPFFVKPSCLGSSIGISKVYNKKELQKALKKSFLYGDEIIIEKGIDAREIECSVLGNGNPKVSLPGEIIPSREFYSYEAKYLDKDNKASKLIIPAKLSQEIIKEIQTIALKAFKIMKLSGMARVDFLIEKRIGKVYLNECNTIPGFTKISMYPKLWEASGLNYSNLLDELVKLAEESFRKRKTGKKSKKNFILCDINKRNKNPLFY